MLNLKNKYKLIILPLMKKEFLYKSIMEAPLINKIVLNVGLGKFNNNKKMFDMVYNNLYYITDQKPILTIAKKSIASFKIRKKINMGYKVTLRKDNMWNFLEKLIRISIPRIRDFQGFTTKSFDKTGNFNIGIKEHNIFPEINFEKIEFIHGLNINIHFNKKILIENKKLLSLLNFPFKK